MVVQIDLYVGIHKGHRGSLFKVSVQAAKIDLSSHGSVQSLHREVVSFRDAVRVHIELEEKFIHPLLSDRVPGGARELEAEHRDHFERLDDLVAHLDGIRTKSVSFEKRRELALEFYRALNRFIALYLVHLNKEEEEVQPTLWKLCADDELMAAFGKMLASQSPEELAQNFSMMIPALSLDELAGLYAGIRAKAPPQVIQMFAGLAEQLLSKDDWAEAKKRFAKV